MVSVRGVSAKSKGKRRGSALLMGGLWIFVSKGWINARLLTVLIDI